MQIEALSDLRNKIFASRWFQDGAVRIPGVRGVAQKRAAQLFDLTAGFVYSQVLYACVELDLFRRLSEGPVPIDRLAEELSLAPDAVKRLGKAGASLDLLEVRSRDRLALGPQGAALLANPSVFAMIRHHRILFEDLADPVAMLRAPKGETGLGAFWSYSTEADAHALPPERIAEYSELMETTQAFIARDVVAAHDFSRHRHVLDIGGGSGAFLEAIAPHAGGARLSVFDLPAVAEKARSRLREAGLADRIGAVGGDFRHGPFPAGVDLVTLIRVLHDHDTPVVEELLRSVHRALDAGGQVLIAEPLAETKGAAPMGDAYFGVYLWAMGHGEPRTAVTLKKMLSAAGFRKIRQLKTRRPMLTSAILAEK